MAVEDASAFGVQRDLVTVLPLCQIAQARVLEHLEHGQPDENGDEQEGKAPYHQT
jgi:hypothetical protein